MRSLGLRPHRPALPNCLGKGSDVFRCVGLLTSFDPTDEIRTDVGLLHCSEVNGISLPTLRRNLDRSRHCVLGILQRAC